MHINSSLHQTVAYIEDITRWREDMNFMFEWQKRYLTSEPTCNVLFIIWRSDVIEIADFYFIVFEKLSKFYKSLFVFTESTKHLCPGYRNNN